MPFDPVDFDVDDFLIRIQGNKPPFRCPSDACKQTFKSYSSIQKHMLTHRPSSPIHTIHATFDYIQKVDSIDGICNLVGDNTRSNPLNLTLKEYSAFVVFNSDRGQTFRCNVMAPLNICFVNESNTDCDYNNLPLESSNKIKNGRKPVSKNTLPSTIFQQSSCINNDQLTNSEDNLKTNAVTDLKLDLPKPVFEIDPEYMVKKSMKLNENSAYIRFVDKSTDELDELIEYDLDEEDLFWLERINTQRSSKSLSLISESILEWVIDRFEKESRFRFLSTPKSSGEHLAGHSSIDDDAVCAVCQDGSCENTNVILFCDVCNLAVHQECYGVPYVPEGPWLCRKCLHSPSQPVSCVLCPNQGGAFKKTSDDRWAHVICGLWVPEVMFANLTFLEPLEGIDRITAARWKLQCFVCKQRNAGACIQCHKTTCYRAFHVTCAQQAGLYMKIEHISDDAGEGGIRKSAFCAEHCPPNHFTSSNKGMYADSDSDNPPSSEQAARIQIRKARKFLAQRRNSAPSVCVPVVPKTRIDAIAAKLEEVTGSRMEFLGKAYAFWKLKREFRRGVPLLKRLQGGSIYKSAANFAVAATTGGDAESVKIREQLGFWQKLRQNLETARLLSELVKKRERIKNEIYSNIESEMRFQLLSPFKAILLRLLDDLQAFDDQSFFAHPVSTDIAPDYYVVIKRPMDFATMRDRVRDSIYSSVAELQLDFDLMMDNCLIYNRKGSIYAIKASKMLQLSKPLFAEAESSVSSLPRTPERAETKTTNSSPPSVATSHTQANTEPTPLPVASQEQTVLTAKDDQSTEDGGQQNRPPKSSPVSSSTRSRLRDGFHVSPTSWSGFGELAAKSRPSLKRRRRSSYSSPPDNHNKRKQVKLDPQPTNSPVKIATANISIGSNKTVAPPSPTQNPVSPSSSAVAASTTTRSPQPVSCPVRSGPSFMCYRLDRAYSREEEEVSEEDEEEEDDQPSDVEPLRSTVTSATTDTTIKTDQSITDHVTNGNNDPVVATRRKSLRSSGCDPATRIVVTECGTSRQASGLASRHRPPTSVVVNSSRQVRNSTAILRRSIGLPLVRRSNKKIVNRRLSPILDESNPLESSSNSSDHVVTGSGIGDQQQLLGTHHEEEDNVSSPPTTDSSTMSLTTTRCENPTPSSLAKATRSHSVSSSDASALSPSPLRSHLAPLDLVWAKCRGSPWYPALLVDPGASEGQTHNGVPVPCPPSSVLACATADLLLVLFFDTKRTWQWLPRHKLEPLGAVESIDTERLRECKRHRMRKSVAKAYARAIEHLCKVHGCQFPFSDLRPTEVPAFILPHAI